MANDNSTQNLVEIKEISNGVITLNNNSLRRIIMVAGTNFDLLSSEGQELIIFAYQNFLNTLNFPVQIFINSRKLNIENLLKYLKQQQQKEMNGLLKNLISDHYQFIKTFVEDNPIMAKRFFIVIPYESSELEKRGYKIWKKYKQENSNEITISDEIKKLDIRTEEVISGLSRLGLRAIPLIDDELIELFYNLYNPSIIEKKVAINR